MDILYTADEKYLQAVEELYYGELAKALHLFNEIISSDPEYGRAYYHLGCCYFEHFKNYQTAGYYFKKCIELEPDFPDVYDRYLKLLVTLNMHKTIQLIAEQALATPGVCKASIHESLGLYAEQQQNLAQAKAEYKLAAMAASSQENHTLYKEHLNRIEVKLKANNSFRYSYQG